MDFYSEVGLVECTEEFYARQLQHLPKLCHYPAINGERRLSLCITINTRHTCTILMLVSIARRGIEPRLTSCQSAACRSRSRRGWCSKHLAQCQLQSQLGFQLASAPTPTLKPPRSLRLYVTTMYTSTQI